MFRKPLGYFLMLLFDKKLTVRILGQLSRCNKWQEIKT